MYQGNAALSDCCLWEKPAANDECASARVLPGQYFDSETGLHYNYFRDYDPVTGRYIESDPIGLQGGLNTYLYGNANPVRYIDPTGEDAGVTSIVVVGGWIIIAAAGAKACAETNCTKPITDAIDNAIDVVKDLCTEDNDERCEKAKQKAQSIYYDLTTKRIPQFLSGGTKGRDPKHRQIIIQKQSGLKNAINKVRANCKVLPPELPAWERVANMPIPAL